jgi:hypothetical protein
MRLRLWVNGTLAAEATDRDGPLPNGAAGLEARLDNGGSGGEAQVLFDDFEVDSIG